MTAAVRAGAEGTKGAEAALGSGATVVAYSIIGLLGCTEACIGAARRLLRRRRRWLRRRRRRRRQGGRWRRRRRRWRRRRRGRRGRWASWTLGLQDVAVGVPVPLRRRERSAANYLGQVWQGRGVVKFAVRVGTLPRVCDALRICVALVLAVLLREQGRVGPATAVGVTTIPAACPCAVCRLPRHRALSAIPWLNASVRLRRRQGWWRGRRRGVR